MKARRKSNMAKAIVIIPTYNEQENIQRAIDAVLANAGAVKAWDLHILVVDDTSPDKTYELVDQIAKKNKRIHLLVNKQKSGLGGAYLKGMAYAFGELQADVVFEFDADLSHDPTKIPQFLQEIDSGADMVLGTRYKLGGSIPADWGWHRKFLSVFGNIVIRVVLGSLRYSDWTSGYRAITKKVYEAVVPKLVGDRFSGYTFQIGFLYYATKFGFDIRESVPYHFVDREVGQSKIGPEYMKNTLEFIFKVRLQELFKSRIFKFAVVGGVGALVQLVSLQIFRTVLSSNLFVLASFLSIEVAVISNFIWNNVWTFKDKQLKPGQIPLKFVTFNLSSAGSIVIQLIVAWLGEKLFSLAPLFTVPGINVVVDRGHVYAVLGILIGMAWNFFAYNRFVWNAKSKKK